MLNLSVLFLFQNKTVIRKQINSLFGKFNLLQIILSVSIDLSNMASKRQQCSGGQRIIEIITQAPLHFVGWISFRDHSGLSSLSNDENAWSIQTLPKAVSGTTPVCVYMPLIEHSAWIYCAEPNVVTVRWLSIWPKQALGPRFPENQYWNSLRRCKSLQALL